MATKKSGSTNSKPKAASKAKSSAAKSTGRGKGTNSKASSSSRPGGSSKAVTAKTAGSKKTNSGGTARTSSKQAEPTKSKQAKKAQSGTRQGSKETSKSTVKRGSSAAAKKTGAKPQKNDGLLTRMVKGVAKVFAGGPPDAIELLKKDHRKVEDLFSKVKANEDGNNTPTFKKIKAELDVHAHIEEKIFYPFILDRGDQELNRIVREGFEEHKQIKMFLEELTGLSGTTETFRARIKVLMEDVEHHVKEEEDEMFPMVRDQIGEDDLVKLGAKLAAEKERAMKRSGKSSKVSTAGKTASATA